MTSNSVPHLCGGIFYGLLLEARKPRKKARDKVKGGTDGLSNTDLYGALIHVVCGDGGFYGDSTLKKCASDYKKCESSKGSYVPFTEPSTISAFASAVNRKDPDLLKRMTGFIDKFLSITKCEWLVRVLIDTIQKDNGISDDELFAVDYGKYIKASNLHQERVVVLQPFLITVLNFILQYSPDAESGKSTFLKWYEQAEAKSEWKLKKDFDVGNSIDPIEVKIEEPDIQPKKAETITAPPQLSDEKSDHEVIEEQLYKSGVAAATVLADAIDKLNLPSEEQILKTGQIMADAFGAVEHQMADEIRRKQKETKAEEPEAEGNIDELTNTEIPRMNCKNDSINDSEIIEDVPKNAKIVHQTIVNQYGDHPVHIDHVENLKL